MKRTKINDAEPGMKLAKPVENESGIALYGAGMELTPAIIERLKAMGTEAVFIEGAIEYRFPKKADYMAVVETAFSKSGGKGINANLRKIMKAHVEAIYGNR